MKNHKRRLIFRKVDANNLKEWVGILLEIFGYNATLCGCTALDEELYIRLTQFELFKDLEYWIAYHDDSAVGATGLYKVVGTPENESWLGWFGVLSSKQGKGYGSEMLIWTENFAKHERGVTILRYYTEIDNQGTREKALGLYRKHGFTEEGYHHPEAVAFPSDYGFQIIVGSKSLVGDNVPPWSNRFLDLMRNFKKTFNNTELNEILEHTTKKFRLG